MPELEIPRALYVQIPDDLDRKLRQHCLNLRCSLTDAVTEALERYLENKAKDQN